jgi:hypothetical protein
VQLQLESQLKPVGREGRAQLAAVLHTKKEKGFKDKHALETINLISETILSYHASNFAQAHPSHAYGIA